jgi:hypothetical protein
VNQLYLPAKQMMLEAKLNWLADPIYVILLDTTYYLFSANHASLDDVDGRAFVRSSPLLAGKSIINGAADAADVSVPPVMGGPIIRALILVKDGGNALDSKLIAYIDTAANLPYTPDGRNIVIIWDDGPNRVFRL